MTPPSWLPILFSGISVALALSAFAYQVHRARFNQSVDLLFRLENDFFNGKKQQRAKASADLLSGNALEAEPILDFFETMALLLRRGALDKEMVAHTFFYWIENYYVALQGHIADRQRTDPLVWEDLPKLVETVRALHRKRLGKAAAPISQDQTLAFLLEEQAEAPIVTTLTEA